MKTTMKMVATVAAMMPARIESRAEARTDRALLDDGELGRQRAGAEQDREVVGGLDGEVAADLTGAAEDRLADHRRRDHLVVEHDGERPADVLLGDVAEFARARRSTGGS